jgi:hypothetical protein
MMTGFSTHESPLANGELSYRPEADGCDPECFRSFSFGEANLQLFLFGKGYRASWRNTTTANFSLDQLTSFLNNKIVPLSR